MSIDADHRLPAGGKKRGSATGPDKGINDDFGRTQGRGGALQATKTEAGRQRGPGVKWPSLAASSGA
jgi:hypothetical protein